MATDTSLTHNNHEADIEKILSTNNYFSIPLFQRRYKWATKNIDKLLNDIEQVLDDESTHFLGAIIMYAKESDVGSPGSIEVIDGQQRLISVFLMICALVRVMSLNGEQKWAAAIFSTYLVIANPHIKGSNIKLQPCLKDRGQINYILEQIVNGPKLKKELKSFKLLKLNCSKNSAPDGRLRENYNKMQNFVKKHLVAFDTGRVKEICNIIFKKFTVVQIMLKDPTSGPTIFSCLNEGQFPMTIGDLVQNSIFSKISDKPASELEELDEHFWRPFYDKFEFGKKNFFDDYFFPFGLIHDQNLKKADTSAMLNRRWKSIIDPKIIIGELSSYQNAFLDLKRGTNFLRLPKNIEQKYKKFHLMSAPSSVFPFIMKITKIFESGKVSEDSFLKILNVLETFLVRRAVCGLEPTGLHAVFKRLWNDIKSDVTPTNTISVIKSHKTVQWIDNNSFKESFKYRDLYGSKITPFIIKEFNKSLGGDIPDNIPHLEHVLPQNPDKSWDYFKEDDREKYLNVLANLTPLSKEMNSGVSNKSYEIKRNFFEDASMYRSTRDLAKKYSKWTKSEIEDRAEKMSEWALKEWNC